ncbi:MAG: DUF4294 domain-containing protein [Paludibacteraceae bacterium]|nr:DUF4294 domain-containing protein [Paludibacteraceae bacterium]MBQ5379290.1 DUF4294 domain-containing protein [Paludibacteraceae bacterium]
MKRLLHILLLLAVGMNMFAAKQYMDSCMIRIEDGDTLYMAWLHEVWVYPPLRFKNKRQEKFYWKTVRDVKKCLPYAKMITADMAYADAELAKLPDDKSRRKWWKAYERTLFKKYEKDFRGMYASQGMMLMKLMDRETDRTSYELIKQYKGKAAANWWQFIAKLFKNDLKEEYDAADKDKIIERVINLVEAGQL